MSVGVVKSDELHLQHPNLVARGSTSSVSTFDLGVCHSEWRLLSLVLNNLHHETAYQNRHFKNTPLQPLHISRSTFNLKFFQENFKSCSVRILLFSQSQESVSSLSKTQKTLPASPIDSLDQYYLMLVTMLIP